MSDIRFYPANTLAALNEDEDLFTLVEHNGKVGLLDREAPAGTVLVTEKGKFFCQGDKQGLVFGDLRAGQRLRRLVIAQPVCDHDPWQGVVVVEKEFYKPWKQNKTT